MSGTEMSVGEIILAIIAGILAIALWFSPFIVGLKKGISYKVTVFFLCFFGYTWPIAWIVVWCSKSGKQRKKEQEVVLNQRLEELSNRIKQHNKTVIREAENDLLTAHELHSKQLIDDEAFKMKKLKIRNDLADEIIDVNTRDRKELLAILERNDSIDQAFAAVAEDAKAPTDSQVVGSALGALIAGSVLSSLFQDNTLV